MPIKIDNDLPAREILERENIFVMTKSRAEFQEIRPLKIAILNLMPMKSVTETQLLRLIGNTPIQVDITLLHPASYVSQNTPSEHLINFYKTFDEIKKESFDGLIITGAPVEKMPFNKVDYWAELSEIMEWSKTNVFSTLHICWAAQAGLHYHYGIEKHLLKEKLFGIYNHTINKENVKLLRGFDEKFYAPHSRHTEIRKDDIEKVKELQILSESDEGGIYIVKANRGRQIFVTGHSEYDRNSLKDEYVRDISKGLDIEIPVNYFKEDNPEKEPTFKWRGHANLLYSNWLNYYVYQETPYDLKEL